MADRIVPCEIDARYTVVFHDDPLRGHFEYKGEALGGLWFERLTNQDIALSDYDGCFSLPVPIAKCLRSNKYIVAPEFDHDRACECFHCRQSRVTSENPHGWSNIL